MLKRAGCTAMQLCCLLPKVTQRMRVYTYSFFWMGGKPANGISTELGQAVWIWRTKVVNLD